MQPVSARLSRQQIKALANHYGQQPPPETGGDEEGTAAALLKRGRKIAVEGQPGRKTAPCQSCHGDKERITARYFPRLDGQRQRYLETQLTLFSQGLRPTGDAYKPMPEEAHELAPDDIQAVSAWYASRPPRAKTYAGIDDSKGKLRDSAVN